MPVSPEQQAKIARGVVIKQVRSPYGNINEQGTPYPSQSCFLSRFHPDFEAMIEPGRALAASVLGRVLC